jgi:hypothetical protein
MKSHHFVIQKSIRIHQDRGLWCAKANAALPEARAFRKRHMDMAKKAGFLMMSCS